MPPTQLALFGATDPPAAHAAPAASTRPRALPRLPSLQQLERDAEHYVQEAHAPRTREAYRHDWAAFEAWCRAQQLVALPATTHTLELYLTQLARAGRKASTIRRARVAIGLAHGHAGMQRPDLHPRIRGRIHRAPFLLSRSRPALLPVPVEKCAGST